MRAILFLIVMLCGSTWAQPLQAVHAVQLVSNQNAAEQVVASALIADIYRRAGLEAVITPLPGSRATAALLAGSKDGQVARIGTYASAHPQFIKVEPAFYALTTTAYMRADRAVPISTLAQLASFRVGVIRGIAHAQAATAGLPQVLQVDYPEQLYQMLAMGRIDVAIDTDLNGPALCRRLHLDNIKVAGYLVRHDLFHLLHADKASLAPRLATVIKSMKQSGELARLSQRYQDAAIQRADSARTSSAASP
jgi:ABC-type amino acid transport substrate-binding protein